MQDYNKLFQQSKTEPVKPTKPDSNLRQDPRFTNEQQEVDNMDVERKAADIWDRYYRTRGVKFIAALALRLEREVADHERERE